MNRRPTFLLVIFSVLTFSSFSQRLKKADRVTLENIKSHISYLANDKLEGRRAGTPGEKLAAQYISNQFGKAGLKPLGSNSWLQPFEINDGKMINPETLMFVNGQELKTGTEFFPLCYSPNAHAEAAVAIALRERDVPWFEDIHELIESNKENPHYDLYEGIREKAKQAAEKGATALIIYNSGSQDDNIEFRSRDRSDKTQIPVIYIPKNSWNKYFSDESSMLDLKFRVDIGDKKRTGNNVIGYLDNGASSTVILGAHYDHLGYGEDGNSMVRTTEKQIHNGADDNASGTSVLMELARLLKSSGSKKNNYLFIAFSGEELGLNGSKFFTENPSIDLSSVNYMINMDMVGRLNDSSKALTIGGYGTSPVWSQVISSIKDTRNFTIKYDSSGAGPSDHTSFYRKDIPVLFFFTGLHTDYHRPSDDANKINAMGALQITKLISQVIGKTSDKGKLAFTKTREMQMATSARFTVSLGIMPDYTFPGQGVKVDGVSTGKAAEKAGMKIGDVIVGLGEQRIHSMESYMQALSKFKKGDSTVVKFKRGTEELQANIEFK